MNPSSSLKAMICGVLARISLSEHARELATLIRRLPMADGEAFVRYTEQAGRHRTVWARPIDVAPVLRHEETWTPGPINSMDVAIWDVTVPGAMPGDFVGAAHDMMSCNALLISAFCWSADNVRVVIFNTEHGQVNVPEGTLRVIVWK